MKVDVTEDYVSFEIAKLLKEKGFDENTPVNYFVGDDKPRGCAVGEMIHHKRAEEDTHLIACPTLQMAMKWLRKVHNLHVEVHYNTFWDYYQYIILYCGEKIESDMAYHSFEDAAEAVIKFCLKKLI